MRNPPKTLDSLDSFDRKLALSIAKDFVSEAACGEPFEFLKVLQVSFCSAEVGPIENSTFEFLPDLLQFGFRSPTMLL